MIIENEIEINASRDQLWDILVNPEKTILYMFGCEVVSDWSPGGSIIWRGSTDGVIYVKGHLVDIDPGNRLVYTVIDPNGVYEDIPENYLTVTYEIFENGEQIRLKVTQGDYSKVADGEKRYQDSLQQGGWQGVLEKIKEIAESE